MPDTDWSRVGSVASWKARIAARTNRASIEKVTPSAFFRLDPAEGNPWVDVAIATDLGSGRNLLVARSNAVIAIGGGAGTRSEFAFAWMYKRLVVAVPMKGWSVERRTSRAAARPSSTRRGACVRSDECRGRARDRAAALAALRAPSAEAPHITRRSGHTVHAHSRVLRRIFSNVTWHVSVALSIARPGP